MNSCEMKSRPTRRSESRLLAWACPKAWGCPERRRWSAVAKDAPRVPTRILAAAMQSLLCFRPARSTHPMPRCACHSQTRQRRLPRTPSVSDTAKGLAAQVLPGFVPSPSCARPESAGAAVRVSAPAPSRNRTGQTWAGYGACRRLFRNVSMPALKSRRVLLPKEVVQKNAHGVHAQIFRPSELLINLLRIKRVRLPHLKLVDRVHRHKITAHQPRLLGVPRVCLRLGPSLSVGVHSDRRSNTSNTVNTVEFDRMQMPPMSRVVLTRSAGQRRSENRGSQLRFRMGLR